MLMREFLIKNKTLIMPEPPYTPDLASADFFRFPKLKTRCKKSVLLRLRRDKRKIETGAVGNTKKRISEMLRELEKTLALVY